MIYITAPPINRYYAKQIPVPWWSSYSDLTALKLPIHCTGLVFVLVVLHLRRPEQVEAKEVSKHRKLIWFKTLETRQPNDSMTQCSNFKISSKVYLQYFVSWKPSASMKDSFFEEKKTKRKAWKKFTPTQLPDQLGMSIRGAGTTALDHRLVSLV